MQRPIKNRWPGVPVKLSDWRVTSAALGLLVSVLAAIAVDIYETRRLEIRATQSVERRMSALSRSVRTIEVTVSALAAHIKSVGEFKEDSARIFASSLTLPTSLEALQFVELVAAEDRALHENLMRGKGHAGYSIRILGTVGEEAPEGSQPYSLVVTFMSPEEASEAFLGLDLFSNPVTRDAMERAARSNSYSTTTLYSINDIDGGNDLFSVFVPIYRSESNNGLEDVIGFASAVVNLEGLVIESYSPQSYISNIWDVTDKKINIYSSKINPPRYSDRVRNPFDAGSRKWEVEVAAIDVKAGLFMPMVAFGIGILSTLLLITLFDRANLRQISRKIGEDFARSQQLLDFSHATYQALFGNIAVGAATIDAGSNRFISVNDKLCEMLGYSRGELMTKSLDDIVVGEQETGNLSSEADLRSFHDDGNHAFEQRFTRKDGSLLWGLVSVSSMEQPGTGVTILTTVMQDITDKKQADQSLKTLVRELAHRVRNTTQIISSLADQTRRQATDLDEYHRRFQGRLRALTSAQDLLFDASWRQVRLADVVQRVLLPFVQAHTDILTTDIDDIKVSSQEAQTLALTIHELAANATRYGAWSSRSGRVELQIKTTRPKTAEAECAINLIWTESGGPPVSEPETRGFGLIMLERLLPAQHNGTSKLEFHGGGLRFSAWLEIKRVSNEEIAQNVTKHNAELELVREI